MGKRIEVVLQRDVEASYERPVYKAKGLLGSVEGTSDRGTPPDANPLFSMIGFGVVFILIVLFVYSMVQGKTSEPADIPPICTPSRVELPALPPPVLPPVSEPVWVEPLPVEPPPPVRSLPPIASLPLREIHRFEPVYPTIDECLVSLEGIIQQFPPSEADFHRRNARTLLEGYSPSSLPHVVENMRANLLYDLRQTASIDCEGSW